MNRIWILLLATHAVASAQFYGEPQQGAAAPPLVLGEVGITQKLNEQIPLDSPFADESGAKVSLRQYAGKPMILALVYYQCPSLCNLVLNGLMHTVTQLGLDGVRDYQVVAVSFDPRETFQMAAEKLRTYRASSGENNALASWHFLTGPETSSKALADSMGFRYAYDAMTNQYAHSSAIVVLTPSGKIARYFYGIDYPVRDVRLALTEASQSRIGSPTDQLLLYCFHYDPTTGKYALVVMNVVRIGGLVTVVLLAAGLLILFRREHRAIRPQQGGAS